MSHHNQWLVLVVFALAAVAMSILLPVLPLYLAAMEIAPQFIGLMFSVSMLAMASGEGYWGWIADRLGVWFPLCMGTLVSGLVVLLFALVETAVLLFAVFFLWGLFRSAVFGPSRGILAAVFPIVGLIVFTVYIKKSCAE